MPQGNHIFTSGATGTNAAVIRGALRAENPELLTVVLPQSLRKQPPESQELLSQIKVGKFLGFRALALGCCAIVALLAGDSREQGLRLRSQMNGWSCLAAGEPDRDAAKRRVDAYRSEQVSKEHQSLYSGMTHWVCLHHDHLVACELLY